MPESALTVNRWTPTLGLRLRHNNGSIFLAR